MKILIISRFGEDVANRQIPAALAKAGPAEITVVVPEKVAVDKTYNPRGFAVFEKETKAENCRLLPVPLNNPEKFWLNFRAPELRKAIESVAPDIIQFWGGPADTGLLQVVRLNRKAGGKAKIFFYGFDNLPLDFGPKHKRWFWQWFWRRVWTKVAGGFEADSEAVENVRRAGYRGPIRRVFWGVPTDVFAPLREDRSALKKELALEYPKLVGYVGRLVREKGLDVLLKAMPFLPPDIHVLIIGGGPLQKEIAAEAQTEKLKGHLHLLGPVKPEMLVRYLNCLDVLALPSLTTSFWKEQYGRIIGEAMACGVPVVGSNSGAIPEVIGRAGLVVPEDDPVGLARALQRAIFDQPFRQRIIPAGLERAEKELSVKVMAQALCESYWRTL